MQCWDKEPENRLTFSEFVSVISTSLEGMSGYLDLTTPSFSTEHILNHLMMCSKKFIMTLITLYNASLWPTDHTRGEVSVIFNF